MTDDKILEKYLERYKGYTPDFYMCVYQYMQEHKEETDIETAVAICERMYG
jgi:hypothetical protein